MDVFDQKMETPLSTVLQVYSDYRPFSVKDQTLASAVSYILDQIYTDTLREDEGGTYGASSSASARKYPDGRYLLQVYFNSKPALAEKLRTLAQDGFRKLAEEGPTDEQFTRTVENFKKNVPESRINNSYWLSNILRYFRNGYDYDQEWEAAVNGQGRHPRGRRQTLQLRQLHRGSDDAGRDRRGRVMNIFPDIPSGLTTKRTT